MESIIADRFRQTLESATGLSDKQFGFRRGRSTLNAIAKVMRITTEAISRVRRREDAKKYCAIVTLDTKNAFNSASWMKIIQTMFKFGVPGYMRKILDNRQLLYETDKEV